jgi:hypothetical protein
MLWYDHAATGQLTKLLNDWRMAEKHENSPAPKRKGRPLNQGAARSIESSINDYQ